MWGDIAIAFLLAFITAFVITPYTIKLAKRVGAIDMPNDRRVNKKPIPRIGGVAIIAGFIVSVIFLVISMKLENKLLFKDSNQYLEKLVGFFVGIVILGTMAYIDDIKSLKPWQKLIAQIVSATILYIFEVRIDAINGFIIHPVFSYILTVGWIVGITNAVNLIDGLDGLSSGTTLISCIFLLIIFATNGSSMISVILITALAGAITGFLPFNANPAKTFMGDVGSQFLGFSLAVISIFGIAKTVTLVVLIAPVLVLGLPIFDTIFAIIRRIKKGKSLKAVFQPDKGHLHHRLIAKGYTQKQAVIILYAITAALGMFVVAVMLWIGRAELSRYNSDLLKSNKKDME